MAIVIQHETGSVGALGGLTPEWESLYQQDAARKDAMARSIGASIANVGQVMREDARYRQQSVAAAQQQQFENQQAIERAQTQQQQFDAELGLRQQAGQRADVELAQRDRAQQFAEFKQNENAYLQRLIPYEELADAMPDDKRAQYKGYLSAVRQTMTRPMTEFGRQSALDSAFAKLDEMAALAQKKKTMQEQFESSLVEHPLTREPMYVNPRTGNVEPLGGNRDDPFQFRFSDYSALYAKMMAGMGTDADGNPIPVSPEMAARMTDAALNGFFEAQKRRQAALAEMRVQMPRGGEPVEPPQPQAPPQPAGPQLVPSLGRDIRDQVVQSFGTTNLASVPLEQRRKMVDAAISERKRANSPAPSLRKPISQWEPKDIDEEIAKQGPKAEMFRVEIAQADAEISGRVARAIADQEAGRITPQEFVAIKDAAIQQAEALRRDLLKRLSAPPPEEKFNNMRRWAESTNPTASMNY